MASPSDDVEYWIYHERQQASLCGQHALNNLVQACVFQPDALTEIAFHLDNLELQAFANNNEGGTSSREYIQRMAEGSGNVDGAGNFSIQVLSTALKNKYKLDLPNIRQQGVGDSLEVTEIEGFICNREAHWFAIRKINGRYWNLNSMAERPMLISHFKLAAEIQALQVSGYSVFCVPSGLNPACSSKAQRERGLPQYWWKEDDLVQGKGNSAVTAATDPWRDVGSGMRLDGRTAAATSNDIGDLTEDEMLQMALAASMEKPAAKEETVPLTPEPSTGTEGAVRIQFRLPSGGRKVRKFLKDDSVKMLYTYVDEESKDGQGKSLELRFGFPPKDLRGFQDKTVGEANLAGEAIQGRYV